ncbi:hypothetical protein CCHR01_18624 [Colletotrichum chrysophilum]|uniref:Uncharacterized protein n=1 Tax=Colletotrichum chrysophilum TaxID=1836956 RepID=A0AAD9E8Q8_9PEZI|nr:hypothetical protein CCHR01_18624 [Colletotrichum chrysophilum]
MLTGRPSMHSLVGNEVSPHNAVVTVGTNAAKLAVDSLVSTEKPSGALFKFDVDVNPGVPIPEQRVQWPLGETVHFMRLRTDEGLAVSDTQPVPAFSDEKAYHVFLGAPLLWMGNTVGMLTVQSQASWMRVPTRAESGGSKEGRTIISTDRWNVELVHDEWFIECAPRPCRPNEPRDYRRPLEKEAAGGEAESGNIARRPSSLTQTINQGEVVLEAGCSAFQCSSHVRFLLVNNGPRSARPHSDSGHSIGKRRLAIEPISIPGKVQYSACEHLKYGGGDARKAILAEPATPTGSDSNIGQLQGTHWR